MMTAKVGDVIEAENVGTNVPAIENIQIRKDGTYVVSYGGAPYHATKTATPDVYERVIAEIEGGVDVTEYVEHESPKPDPLAEAVAEYNRLRGVTDFVIAPLQDAVDVGEATDTEIAALQAWKKYRVALSRVPDQQGYPMSIDWPAAPV
jgi:hypothetical protein